MSGKPIDDAVLTTVRFLGGGVVQMDRADYDRLTAAQQQGQAVACPDCGADALYECVACSSTNYPAQPMQQGGGEVAWRLAEEIRVPVGQRPRSANDSPLSPPIVTEWETHYRWVATVSTITKTPAPPSAPVGVERLIAEWKMLIAHPDTSTIMRATLENVVIRLQHTLAAQPGGSDNDR